MNLEKKYQLLEPLPGEGARSFRARQTLTGREVSVHLLPGGHTPQNEELLARLRTLPLPALAKLLEVGEQDGIIYIVIEAPPQHLLDWLAGNESNAPAGNALPDTQVVVGGPSSRGAQGQPNPIQSQQPPVAAARGEFTQMFQASPAPTSSGTPPPSTAPPAGAGEFTRVFTQVQPQAPATEPPLPSAPQPVSAKPGEFTELFPRPPMVAHRPPVPESGLTQEPPAAADSSAATEPPSPSAPQPVSAKPGEFTQLFQRPAQVAHGAPAPESPLTQEPPATAATPPSKPLPGEFTQFFQRPAISSPIAGQQSGGATGLFETPTAPPTAVPERSAPATNEAGEFTRLWGQQPPQPPGPAAQESGQPGGFTQFLRQSAPGGSGDGAGSVFRSTPEPVTQRPGTSFSSPSAGSEGATGVLGVPTGLPPLQPGESEYTRVISRPPTAAAVTPSAVPQAGSPPAAPQLPLPQLQPFPQMPVLQMPPPSFPQPPAMPAPGAPPLPKSAQSAVAGPSVSVLVTAILCLLSFLAGGLLVFFLLRH
jgi:hypothetical protein